MQHKLNNGKGVPSKWLVIPIVLLALHLLFRLIDQAKIMWIFPLDTTNDISSYMGMLHFFREYGMHGWVPSWYGGFTLFSIYAPGWFLFVYPLAKIISSIQIVSFLSLILMYVLGFLMIYFFIGKILQLSKISRIALFLFFFANPIVIGNFVRLMRLPSMFGWIAFLAFASVIYWYRDRSLDVKFVFLFGTIYGIVLLGHQAAAILTHVFLLGFLLVKSWKERLVIVGSMGLGALTSSFWWFPMIGFIDQTSVVTQGFSRWLFDFSAGFFLTNIANLIIPPALVVLAYLCWKSKTFHKRDLVFYSPVLILAVLFFFKIVAFLPIFRYVYPDPYQEFFLFFAGVFFLKADVMGLGINWQKLLHIGLVGIVILGVAVNAFRTPLFTVPGEMEENVKQLLPFVEHSFLILPVPKAYHADLYPRAFYSYGSIFHNLTTPDGWGNIYSSPEQLLKLEDWKKSWEAEDCERFNAVSRNLDAGNVIGIAHQCDFLEKCGWKAIREQGGACLYEYSM